MVTSFDFLRELNIGAVIFRLVLAMLFGGLIGLERGRKWGSAGLRTYMLVCLGASLTMLLGQYELYMLTHEWAEVANSVGIKTDISRFGAQVINGIGFLGAGTIIVTGRQEVKGLTTAAGLWASACVGLAIGAVFYECVFLAFVLILIVLRLLPYIETLIIENARNVNIYIEFNSLDNIGEIISKIKELNVHIFEVEIDRGSKEYAQNPSAIFTIRLNEKQSHTKVLSAISEVDSIRSIEEI